LPAQTAIDVNVRPTEASNQRKQRTAVHGKHPLLIVGSEAKHKRRNKSIDLT
jgi:hypothetical protein